MGQLACVLVFQWDFCLPVEAHAWSDKNAECAPSAGCQLSNGDIWDTPRMPETTVLIPAAPRDDVVDTIRSVAHWMPKSQIVVLNDGDQQLDVPRIDQLTVLPSLPYPRNAYGGLWAKICYGLRWIRQNCPGSNVLRLDADALILRAGLSSRVATIFDNSVSAGIIGGVSLHGDGTDRDCAPAREAIEAAASFRSSWRPSGRRHVRRLVSEATKNKYLLGEHAIACACVLRTEMIDSWAERGWLDSKLLSESRLADDFIMALMCYAAKFEFVEAGGVNGLFRLSWRGLPCSPFELMSGGAYATHSVRSFGELDEYSIRREFATARSAAI